MDTIPLAYHLNIATQFSFLGYRHTTATAFNRLVDSFYIIYESRLMGDMT